MKSAYVVRNETADGPEVAMKIEDFIDGMTEHVAVILIVHSPDDELVTLLKVEAQSKAGLPRSAGARSTSPPSRAAMSMTATRSLADMLPQSYVRPSSWGFLQSRPGMNA